MAKSNNIVEWRHLPRPSAIRINRNRERRFPCLMPSERLKGGGGGGGGGEPSTNTEKKVVETSLLT
jgi:hypothetical protein